METSTYDSSNLGFGLWSLLRTTWDRRHLVLLLVRRDLNVRYRRSILGTWWSLLNPLMTSLVIYLVLSNVFSARMPTGVSYAPYLLAGILFITLFNQGLSLGAESIASGAGILTKVYVPAHIFAVASVIATSVNFVLGLIPLTCLTIVSGQSLSARFPLAFLVLFLFSMFITGLALLVSMLFILFDDARSIVAVLLLLLGYLTPTFYPREILGGTAQRFINWNPLTSFLDCLRWSLSDQFQLRSFSPVYMTITSLTVFWLGASYFTRVWPNLVARL